VIPVDYLDYFSESYPNNCSSWFLPSNAELFCLSLSRIQLNTVLSWVSGDTLSSTYWSSTSSADGLNAYAINMDSQSSELNIRTELGKVRYICAY
jgi:hypothetical protein